MAYSLDDLLVYQKSLHAAAAISAILIRPGLVEDLRLKAQLEAASERVASLIAEGYAQKTDRHFAYYLYQARGSSKETRTQLIVARGRGYISEGELSDTCDRYNEIERMLTGLIKHLKKEDRKLRG